MTGKSNKQCFKGVKSLETYYGFKKKHTGLQKIYHKWIQKSDSEITQKKNQIYI